MDGVIYSEVYKENTDVYMVKGFLERLLLLCGRYPKPRSVVFIDNALFYFLPRIKEILTKTGILIEY